MFKSERIIIKKNDEDKPVKELERDEIEKFIKSLDNPEVIEIVYVKIKHAYVFKLPSHQSSSSGWKGADWRKQIWKGRLKIVERTNIAAIVLEDSTKNNIFAICPIRDGAVDRCIDSSRYFILRIENSLRRHIFIGLAFNERNDAFDFNTALEDISREKRCITIKKKYKRRQ